MDCFATHRSVFRQNILSGDRDTYTHLYHFLFEKMPELQKRAYLAKYLVKIEVSPDLEGDNDIVELYAQASKSYRLPTRAQLIVTFEFSTKK
jgi:hypothetical protein